MSDQSPPAKKKGPGPLGKLYLTLYNSLQTAGWSYILLKSLVFIANNKCYKGVFEHSQFALGLAQTAAFFEVLHCVIGLVPSNPILTFVQILSRVVVFWGILVAVPESRVQIGLPLLLFPWCIAEITRYLYYVLSLYNACPPFITWCRYSFFIVLYPAGVLGELISMYSALPFIEERQLFAYNLPNKFNISFDYRIFIMLSMFTYLPGFPDLYGHMLKQRSKVLGGEKSDPKKKAQ